MSVNSSSSSGFYQQTADMSVNSSSSANSSPSAEFVLCANSKASISISAFIFTKAILLLPPSIFILCLGHQHWWRRHSFSTTSHSKVFTFHMAVMNLIGVFGSPFYFWGTHADLHCMALVGFCCAAFTLCGEILFHILTCVDRYLAAVHPIAYLQLKKADGVKIRNITIRCVWLLCTGCAVLTGFDFPNLPLIPFSCLFVFSFIVVSFCSFSVVCVLIRPGPGEGGGDRGRVDQSKQRAFHTIMAIMGVLWLWYIGYLVCLGLSKSPLLSYNERCVALLAGVWCNLPGSLVLPLLFLYREEKFPFCRAN